MTNGRQHARPYPGSGGAYQDPGGSPPGGEPPPTGRRRSTLGYIAVILFVFLAGLGLIGAVTVVAAY
jgi:hypothetical protein